MKFILSPNIVEHVKKKDLAGLEIGLRVGGCCCGAVVNTYTRFISHGRADRLSRRDNYVEYEAEGLRILISDGVTILGDVRIDLFRPLGLKVFQTRGLLASGIACRACRRSDRNDC